jgi:hypothetical protein
MKSANSIEKARNPGATTPTAKGADLMPEVQDGLPY